jgi:glycerol-3-phosphate O-acyltransferase
MRGAYQNKIIHVVPVSIKYERVVESESFTL